MRFPSHSRNFRILSKQHSVIVYKSMKGAACNKEGKIIKNLNLQTEPSNDFLWYAQSIWLWKYEWVICGRFSVEIELMTKFLLLPDQYMFLIILRSACIATKLEVFTQN